MKYNIIKSTLENSSVLLLNMDVVFTHFDSITRQLFETEKGSFVYYKDTDTLYKITLESYSKLLYKLVNLVEYYEYKTLNKALL